MEIPLLGLRFHPPGGEHGDVIAYLPPDRVRSRSLGSDSIPFDGIVEEIVPAALVTGMRVRRQDTQVTAAASRDYLARIGASIGSNVTLYFDLSAIRLLKKEDGEHGGGTKCSPAK